MRRGSFFASELNPVSILFLSIFVLGLDGQAAVFLHAPEMNAYQYECHQGENDYVKHIKRRSAFSPTMFPPRSKKRTLLPMKGMAEMMLVPTVTAQKASWSQGNK